MDMDKDNRGQRMLLILNVTNLKNVICIILSKNENQDQSSIYGSRKPVPSCPDPGSND